MKRKLTLALVTLTAILLLQTSGYRLISNSVQPPSGGLANDPNQTNCTHCHTTYGAAFARNTQFVIRVSLDSAGLSNASSIVTGATTFTPGATQWVSLELLGKNTNSPGSTPIYGFQFTALKAAPNDSMAGSFTLADSKTTRETATALNGPVNYVGHSRADTTHVWRFKWTAPDSASGPVTFYYSGNLANGNPANQPDPPYPAGDSIFVGSVTLNPGSPLGISDLSANIHAVSIHPVPFGNTLTADMFISSASDVSLSLLSLEGQIIRNLYSGTAPQGQFSRSFEISDLATGVYLVKVQSGNDVKVIKVLKY